MSSIEDEVVSLARSARKEAQKLVEEVRDLLGDLQDSLRGRSGLDAQAKAAALNAAHQAATAVVDKAQEAVDKVKAAVDASAPTDGGSSTPTE